MLTKCHELSTLKQHKLILLHIWRSEALNESHWVQVRCWQIWLLLEALRIHSLAFSQLLVATRVLSCGSFLRPQNPSPYPLICHHIVFFDRSPHIPFTGTLVITFRAHLDNLGSPHPKILNLST